MLIGLTEDSFNIWFQLHAGVRLHDYLYKDQSIVLPRSNTFHESTTTHRLLIHQVRELGNIDPSRTRGQGCEGIALAHGVEVPSSHEALNS